MVRLTDHGVFVNGNQEISLEPPKDIAEASAEVTEAYIEEGRKKTMSYRILSKHNHSGDMKNLKLRFDSMVSPDNNYVNILQTARAAGLSEFRLPYVLSNCHNTLCAVGGTILEDDHAFGLSNVKKYGGIFLPPYRGVLHQYMREMMAGSEKMILGSDSHTRYGALGTMGIGEGGGELVKQLVGHTYDIPYPKIIGVRLTGKPGPGVGPMDVALSLIEKTFSNGFNKNNVLEFMGPGIRNISMEFRMGIDVMTTESAALSSIWCTDEQTEEYLMEHGRAGDYKRLSPDRGAYYDRFIEIDMDTVEPMIALPFHPSNAMSIREFKADMDRILGEVEEDGNKIKGGAGKPFCIRQHVKSGEFYPDQALVSGCAGGLFENIVAVSDILKSGMENETYGIKGQELNLHVNPASLPIMEDLMTRGIGSELALSGVTMRPCICGPCFGVTDAPANDQLSIRHVTRNYPNREGSKPTQGQMSAVCLMDARSIAATVRNGGKLTAATELDVEYRNIKHNFNKNIYEKQVFYNFGHGDPDAEIVKGPNIADWPEMAGLKTHLLLKVAGSYKGSVTTDELIPSGEISSYRSNPEKISGYTMVSRDPQYVPAAKSVRTISSRANLDDGANAITFGSVMISDQIGDGSSREQAASCQKVLGGFANIANEYSTKRYRSNLINWGLLPLRTEETLDIPAGSYLYIKDIRDILKSGKSDLNVYVLDEGFEIKDESELIGLSTSNIEKHKKRCIKTTLDKLTEEERDIILSGSLIIYYRK
ncbi:hydratase [Oribacterium sp. C9]|uniref:hydratase n=1 Tax=Oribacterium sp. C9 TaxID=1943579 RepID=UPI00098EAFB6|nr:hydratase [Oribacterium sp. C9]OON86238.1 hydratase [Oribacterium sp. C9]